MTPSDTPSPGPMNNPQPRRYVVRKLADVDGLTQAEIAERLDCSQATVQRDLQGTVAPMGKTPGGAPVYPPGRFNDDPEYQERVAQLLKEYPETVARRIAAREFAGSYESPLMRGQVAEVRSEESRLYELRRFSEARAA